MHVAVSPDGKRYMNMALGQREPLPFHLRFVLPVLCRDRVGRWFSVTVGSIAVSTLCVAVLATQRGLALEQAAIAALLWLGLPSIRTLVKLPVLVDAPGMALTLLAAIAWPIEPIAALALVALAAGVSEKAPVFAALFAWQPWLLLGLVVPLIRWLGWRRPGHTQQDVQKAHHESQTHTGHKSRAKIWRDPAMMIFPWGAAAVALLDPGLWWIAVLVVALSQLLIAYDTVRLYQMAAPAVCIAAATVIPETWALPVLVAHWLNPLMGDGL